MLVKIQISDNWFIAYDGRWKMIQERKKESGDIKSKDFTFVSLYDILLRAGQFTELTENNRDLLNKGSAIYRQNILSFKHLLKDKGKIKFFVPSITGGPNHSSISAKHHVISLITKSSDSHLSNNGYSRTQKYPGVQWQSAQLIMETEVGEIFYKSEGQNIEDLNRILGNCGDMISDYIANYSSIDESDLSKIEEEFDVDEDLHENYEKT